MTGNGRSILLLGNYRPALAVARSLAAQGWRVLVSRDEDRAAAARSRAVSGLWDTPDSADPAVLYPALARHLAAHPEITHVFPLAENYVRGYPAHADHLPRDRTWVMPNARALATCLDKAATLDTVEALGLPVARNIAVSDHAALRDAAARLGFPVIVKPADSTIWLGARKALILPDRAALDAALPAWPEGHAGLIVQRFVDGPRLNLYFAASQGRPIRYLAARIGRTDMPDSTGLATDGITIAPPPALRDMADRLIAHLDYHGVGCLQALQDRASGEIGFLEINPRIGGNHAICVHLGMELETLAIALAEGAPVDETLRIAPAGHRYVWTTGALGGIARARANGEIGTKTALTRALRDCALALATRAHVTFRPGDPLPALTLVSRALARRF